MATMNVSLPDSLKTYVDEQVDRGTYGTASEYIRDLIRKDQERATLRALLIEGISSREGPLADEAYFVNLRASLEPSP
ncbi:MAG: type II toxin-antitoxin system ParD family antitoxin [Prochlorococcaceae cyanobacterium]